MGISRRLLFTAGSGVLGVAVLSACSDSAAPSNGPPASASSGPAGSGTWQRVDLSFVSAYLLIRGAEAAIVDLGVPGSGDAIGKGLTEAGSSFPAVRHVVMTHKHDDHAGGLGDVQPLATAAKFYTGEADVSSIQSARPLTALKDGDEVFGLQVIGTPGHTAGHIAIFDPSTGTLVAGDALRTTTDGLVGPDPQYSEDMTTAVASIRKLAALDVRTILPGHGAPLTTNPAAALKKLAAAG
ncbi:MBL fold metallo-hydrolase [Actinoplanes sp. TRM 88003]|uniref:MBL fold metallo-hydrolase n=1 Tax=Paractinoplanes aksuensis TaxID=2939490 RepID=A0ABT1DHN1_9ACTN|nr:MBL fold metallo-hydrolase [Actinoplanes aksuensis]MCO8270332.1 MBL fold metallo-hydrolase [Actinoplanes aksuensis]